MGANVGYTCNSIDNIQDQLTDIIRTLEDLRQDNVALREYGDDKEARVTELEDENNQLQNELDELHKEYDTLYEQCNQLKDELQHKLSLSGKY